MSRPFYFPSGVPVHWRTTEIPFYLHSFQPITMQFDSQNCQAVLSLDKIFTNKISAVFLCSGSPEVNQMVPTLFVHYKS